MLFPVLLIAAVGLTNARWMRKQRSDQPKDTSFIGEATNELSTTILQVCFILYWSIITNTKYYKINRIHQQNISAMTKNEVKSSVTRDDIRILTFPLYIQSSSI